MQFGACSCFVAGFCRLAACTLVVCCFGAVWCMYVLRCLFLPLVCLYFGGLLVSCDLVLVATWLFVFAACLPVLWWFAGFVQFGACGCFVAVFATALKKGTEHSSHQTREEVKDNKGGRQSTRDTKGGEQTRPQKENRHASEIWICFGLRQSLCHKVAWM